MNRAQKIAVFNLAVMMAGAGLVIVLAVVEAVKLIFIALLGVIALVGISPLIFRGEKGHIDFDERDVLIRLRALFFASFLSFCWLIGQCLWQVFEVGLEGSVPVGRLLGMLCGALFTFVITKSLWTLIEYRHGKKRN